MLKCAVYARVSTKLERGRQDPEVQLRQLREFAGTQEWTVTAEYVDHESGAKADRPEYKRMLADASKRRYDILLFWAVDRLHRGGIVPVLMALKHLSRYGVKYRSFQESFIDTTNEFGDLLAAFVAKIAELERKRIRARIRAGLDKARADGVPLGRPRLVVDREKVWKLRDQGMSVRGIAGMLNLSHGSVQRIVQARQTAA
jgi:DNA invertase Pin-like site-specific DNA recombinase